MENWYNVFYWLSVADSVKKFFEASTILFTVFSILSFIGYVICSIGKAVQVSSDSVKNEEDEKINPTVRGWEIARKFFTRLFYPMLILCLISWAGFMLTPTKKDCLLIIAGGAVGNFITTDSSSKALPADVTKFLHLSLKNEISNLSSDVKKELGVQSPKEQLIDKVKDLTKQQLIDYLQKDSTILNKK